MRKPSALRPCRLALLLALLFQARAAAALTLEGVRVTDVTPAGFAVVWKASAAAEPSLRIYADAAGTTEITGSLEVAPLPLQGGDPAAADEVQRQASLARIRATARGLGVQKVGVQGCLPQTTYYFRVASRGVGPETATWPASGLAPVTTARENAFVADARQLLVSVADQGGGVDCTGWLVLASHPEALAAVSALGGDGCAPGQAILDLGRMFGADGTGWQPGGPRSIDLEVLTPAGRTVRRSVGLNFAAGFRVAGVTALTIALDEGNTAPVAFDQAVGTNEDTPLSITLAATDADDDPLAYTVLAGPDHGTLSGTAPELTYTPAADYHGPDGFSFRAGDGIAVSAVATVTIEVAAVNDPPVATAQSVPAVEDTPLSVTLAATDAESGALTYEVVEGPGHGELSGTAPQLTYTPDPDFNGVDSFSFRAWDGTDHGAPAAVTITVAAVNDAPAFLATVGDRPVAEGSLLELSLAAGDPDGDPLTYGLVGDAPGAVFDTGTGAFTWVPGYDQAGSYPVTFTVTDGALSDTQSLTITVTDANRPPVLVTPGELTVVEGATVAFSVTASDPDGHAVTYALPGPPPGAVLDPLTGAFSWRPLLDQAGTYPVTFRATDGGVPPASAEAQVTITVANPAGPVFFDDFRDGASTQDWQVVTGAWSAFKGVYTAGSLLKNNLVRVRLLDSVKFPLGAGVLQAKVKLAAATSRVVPNGTIVFGYQSPSRYRWVRVAADGISVGQTGTIGGIPAGMKRRLAKAQPVGVFQQIKVKIFPDGWVRVYKGTAAAPVLSHRFLSGKVPSVARGGAGLAASKAQTVFDNVTVWEDSRL